MGILHPLIRVYFLGGGGAFVGPRILIYSYSKSNQMHSVSN